MGRAASLVLGVVTVAVGGLVAFTAVESHRIGVEHPAVGLFAAAGGGRLHYARRPAVGQGRGTVVLLHGASANQADMMIPLGDRLAALGFDVVAIDRPGHGWSDRPDGAADASPARQAMLIREALEHIGIRHAIMVGHSWAGAVAANFALDHADFVDGLVLLAPVTHPWSTGLAWYYPAAASSWIGPAFAHTLVMPVGLMLLADGVAAVFSPGAPPAAFAERTGLALVLRPRDFVANAQDVSVLLDFVTAQGRRMASIRVPTAIVAGDSDSVVSIDLHSRVDARLIAGATLTVLHGVGHSPHWADPTAVVDAIRSVADRVASRPQDEPQPMP